MEKKWEDECKNEAKERERERVRGGCEWRKRSFRREALEKKVIRGWRVNIHKSCSITINFSM